MEPLMNQSLHICGCCKRELPHEAFYTNKRTGTLDNYCKECRKANTRKRRDLRRCTSLKTKPVSLSGDNRGERPRFADASYSSCPSGCGRKYLTENKKKKN